MILFISDIHLGRSDPATEREIEADLLRCLLAHQSKVERLYLLGDVFDQYIEYRHLVPKGFVRLQALLAEWVDRGIPVTYLVGNHDPWHRDYFQQELGVRVVFDVMVELLHAQNVYLRHGDGLDRSAYIYNGLRSILRHPLPVWFYTNILPGDAGYHLAKWFKHRSEGNAVKPAAVRSLREYAQSTLSTTPASLVVMGHTHYPELTVWPEGAYLNTGFWRESKTFGTLEGDELRLLHWNGTCSEELASHTLLMFST